MLSLPFALALVAAISAPPSPSPSETPSRSAPKPYPRRGDVFTIVGGILAGGILVARPILTAAFVPDLLCVPIAPSTDEGCEDADFAGGITMAIADGVGLASAVPLGLLGTGLERRGRWRAQQDVARGLPMRRTMRARAIAGWTLLGSGVGLWLTTTLTGWFACKEDLCTVAVHETGFYVGAVMVGTGIGLAPFAKGYQEEAQRRRGIQALSVSPTLTHGGLGFALSGRF